MGTGEKITATLSGGAPWGFRLMGGDSMPLVVSKIRKKSKAHSNGIKEGDVIIGINGESTSSRSYDESMAMVDSSGGTLVLEVYRGDIKDLPKVVPSTAAVVNGTTQPGTEETKQDNTTSSQSSSQTITDGDTTTKVETKSWVQQDNATTTSSFTQRKETVTSDARGRSQSPVPFTVDSRYMSQPFTSKPVHVQVSAMISDHSDDAKENVAPDRSSSPRKAMPQFNVRKIAPASQENKWQPSDMFTAKQQKNLQEKQQYMQQKEYGWQNQQQQQQYQQQQYQQQQQQQHQQQQYQQQQYQQHYQQQQQFQQEHDQYNLDHHQQWQPPQTTWKPERQEEWKPNIWQPGQEPPTQESPSGKEEPEEPRLSIQEIQKRLLAPKPVVKSFQPPQPLRQVDINNLDEQQHEDPRLHHKLPVFAPQVQITLEHDSAESDVSTPSSSLSQKKLYADSAFYNDPKHNYPTIQEQMKLCKAISLSLTADSNKKARGASMFAKRQKKSSKWIHDGEKSSSHGGAENDIAYLSDLDSELHITEGGTKPLFTFRIPKVKHRVKPPEQDTKMALSKEEFEQLRLSAKRCDHHSVAPNQCFDLAQSLKTNKGKAGRLFEKRRARAEKYVVDETNVKKPAKAPSNKLEDMLNLKPALSPWEAAMKNPAGDVDGAFDHLSEMERRQKLNQMMQYHTPEAPKPVQEPEPTPMPIARVTKLRADHQLKLLQGKDFNRKARGWTGFQEESDLNEDLEPSQMQPVRAAPPPVAPKPGPPAVHYGDYNPKLKAWHSPEPSMSSPSEYGGRVWTPTSNDSYYMNGSGGVSPNILSPTGYHPPPGGLYSAQPMSPEPHYQHMYNGGYAGYTQAQEALPGSDL